MKSLRQAIQDLIHAAMPFTSGDVVDETSATIPMMDALKKAMEERLNADN